MARKPMISVMHGRFRWIVLWSAIMCVVLVFAFHPLFVKYQDQNTSVFSSLSSSGMMSIFSRSNLATQKTMTSFDDLPAIPHQHVYYLKTHKTASGTVFSILADFCRRHDLMPLVGKKNNINEKTEFDPDQLFLVDEVQKYDMVFNHHTFTPKVLRYLHEDVFKFTMLREPFDNFVSAFWYYRDFWKMSYLNEIEGDDILTTFLMNQPKYEIKSHRSFTNNRQSIDLGFDTIYQFDDVEYIKSFINLTDNTFDMVLITEYFYESIILLKRALRWNTDEIIFFSKKQSPKLNRTRPAEDIIEKQRKLHARYSQADVMLYEYFLSRFEQKMTEAEGLQEEVFEFKEVLEKVHQFCAGTTSHSSSVFIEAGVWTDSVFVTSYRCMWLNREPLEYNRYFRNRLMDVQ